MEIGAGTGDLNGASFVFYGELGRDNYTSEPYQYLRGRGITFASMRSYLLGHASKELVPAHFANRIVFPVWDQSENVLGFKGRTYRAGDKHRPKMVVYPTGSKVGAVPYGLRQAAEYMEEMGFCVIAEGELDVISLMQAGIPAVGAMTSSLSSKQAGLVRQYTGNFLVWADSDKAGFAGATKTAKLLQSTAAEVYVFYCPRRDANAVLQDGGEEELRSTIVQMLTAAADEYGSMRDAVELMLR